MLQHYGIKKRLSPGKLQASLSLSTTENQKEIPVTLYAPHQKHAPPFLDSVVPPSLISP